MNNRQPKCWWKLGSLCLLLIIGLACYPRIHSAENILKQVAGLMSVQVPDVRPWVFIVDDGYAVTNIAAPYVWCPNDKDRATIKGLFIPPFLIYLSRKDLSEALLAHEFAHFLGADEKEAERVQLYFDGKMGGN